MAAAKVSPLMFCLVGSILFASTAHAGEVETWFGGSVSGGVQAWPLGSGALYAGPFSPQVEADFRLGSDLIFLRVDLDAHIGRTGSADELSWGLVSPIPPEWAMLQIGREKYHLRLGVTNPNIGLQQWDEWQNYLPSYSIMWAAQPSQIAGIEPGISFEDGTDVYLYSGYDLGWGGYAGPARHALGLTAGAGVVHSADSWYLSLAAGAYPLGGIDSVELKEPAWGGAYYHGYGTFEYYPLDALTLSLDGGGGVMTGSSFAGGQFQVVVLPETIVSPTARFEALYDPADALGDGRQWSAGAGVKVTPCEFVVLQVEGKADGYTADYGGGVGLSAVALLSIFRPEPDVYSASYEEEEE